MNGENSVRHRLGLTRRQLLRNSSAAIAAPLVIGRASAQAEYPSRPVRVIVPYPPAGGADTVSRILFQKLGETWGQQFVPKPQPALTKAGGRGPLPGLPFQVRIHYKFVVNETS